MVISIGLNLTERAVSFASVKHCPDDDLSREVYGIMGMCVDASDIDGVLKKIGSALSERRPMLVSTPNLNFLITCLNDSQFRESVLASDLCPVDGVPIVWISKVLGLPVKRRVSGSDIFEALKTHLPDDKPCRVYLFGGAPGVADAALVSINKRSSGLLCVGSHFPGYGSIEDMSSDETIEKINASGANFLVVSLGAQKGQAWLIRNRDRISIPVRSHLGATMNFQAGSVKRAPELLRKVGLEWAWRIKQEPYLWRRYWNDGLSFLKLMVFAVGPLAARNWWLMLFRKSASKLHVTLVDAPDSVTLKLVGNATWQNAADGVVQFRRADAARKRLYLDLAGLREIDPRFFGIILMLRKQLAARNEQLVLTKVSKSTKRLFRLNRFEFLLLPKGGA